MISCVCAHFFVYCFSKLLDTNTLKKTGVTTVVDSVHKTLHMDMHSCVLNEKTQNVIGVTQKSTWVKLFPTKNN